jgi:hypothetical protein
MIPQRQTVINTLTCLGSLQGALPQKRTSPKKQAPHAVDEALEEPTAEPICPPNPRPRSKDARQGSVNRLRR